MAIDRFVGDRSAVRHPSGWRGAPDVPKGREEGGRHWKYLRTSSELAREGG